MLIHEEVAAKLTEEDWLNIADEALGYLPRANDGLKDSMNRALMNAGINIKGFTKPIKSNPLSLLNKPVVQNLNNQAIQGSLAVLWLASKHQLREQLVEYFNANQISSEIDGKGVLKHARSFLKQYAKPKLGEVGLGIALLSSESINLIPLDEPEEKTVQETKTSDTKLKRRYEKERARNREFEEKIQYFKAKIAERDEEKARLTDEIESLKIKQVGLAAEVDTAVAEKVKNYMRYLMMDFIDKEEEQDLDKAIKKMESVEKLAISAIEAQVKINKRAGTVVEIREKYDRLQKLLGKLRLLKDESIYVVPQVDKAISAINAEIDSLLVEPTIKELVASKSSFNLQFDMGQISDLEVSKASLPAIEKMFEHAVVLKEGQFISDEEFKQLGKALQDKLTKIIKKHAVPSAANTKIVYFDDKVFSDEYRDKTLVIDGNNIILTAHLKDHERRVADLAVKRKDFNDSVKALARHFAKVLVVYDGDKYNEYPYGENMTLVFTDKMGAGDEADDEIVRVLAGLGENDAIVATSDGRLMKRCGEKACTFLRAQDCYDFFYQV